MLSTLPTGQWSRFLEKKGSFALVAQGDKLDVPRTRNILSNVLWVQGEDSLLGIHLDIRTPFDQSLERHHLEQGLREALGTRRDAYDLLGWHTFFVEDTNLGSSHRVWAALQKSDALPLPANSADRRLPLEAGILALGDTIAERTGQNNFQVLLKWQEEIFSLVFVQGSPFHLLRHHPGGGEGLAARLEGQRRFAEQSLRETRVEWKTFHPADENGCEGQAWRSEPLTLLAVQGARNDSPLWLQLGIVKAAHSGAYEDLELSDPTIGARNESLRKGKTLVQVSLAALLVCAILALWQFQSTRLWTQRLSHIETEARVHAEQVDRLEQIRGSLEEARQQVLSKQALWHRPQDWLSILSAIDSAFPENGGVDRMHIESKGQGHQLILHSWVKEWDDVGRLQKTLVAAQPILGVELSDQRRDPRSEVVQFSIFLSVGSP